MREDRLYSNHEMNLRDPTISDEKLEDSESDDVRSFLSEKQDPE